MSQGCRPNPPLTATATNIFNVPFPGGGYSCGMDMHADGTMLSIVDIFGGYVGTTIPTDQGSAWVQIADTTKLPAAYSTPPTPFLHGGTYGGAIAPSNSSVMYVLLEGNIAESALTTLIKTTNKGVSWTATGAPFISLNAFTGTRNEQGQRVCIDPNNANVVWFGDGTTHTYVSLDGGTTFTQVDGGAGGLPASTGDPGPTAMCFDPTSGTTSITGGVGTNRMLIGISGKGVYVSSDAYHGVTSTWTFVTGSPTSFGFGKMASDGNYYLNQLASADDWYRISTSSVLTTFAFNLGTTNLFETSAPHAIDPNNPSRLVMNYASSICVAGPMNGTPTCSASNFAFAIPASTPQPWFHNAHAAGSGDTGPKSTGNVFLDPFVTTSATSVTIGTGSKTWTDVPTGLNIAVGDTLRVSNTGAINTNWMLGTVTTYTTGNLTISVLSSNPGGYLGTAVGGSGTFSAWTITKERLWVATGTGMFYVDAFKTSGTNNFVPSSWGIEDMVSKHIIWPPGGTPCPVVSDRGVWNIANNPVNATVGQSNYGPNPSTELIEGSGADWASNNTSLIAVMGATASECATNSSNGAPGSWTAFTNIPSGGGVSGIALYDANIMVAYTATQMAYTTNGGSSAWTAMPTVPATGWGSAYGNTTDPAARPLCSDRVNAKIFYAYNSNGSVFKIDLTSGTAVVSTQQTSVLFSNTQTNGLRLAGPPNIGSANINGHLFLCGGLVDFAAGLSYASLSSVCSFVPSGYPFLFSSNAGVTWTSVSNVQMCVFGFGAPKPGGGGYPSIYIAGWVSGVYGIWRCDNWNNFPTLTWTNVGTLARNWMDKPTCIEGDPNQWGRFIIGHYGTSFAIGQVGTPGWP